MRKNRPQSDPPRQGFSALEEIVLTIDPYYSRLAISQLSVLYDYDKQGFNLVLEMFMEHKDKPMEGIDFKSILAKKFIKGDIRNCVLSLILGLYWRFNKHNGGYMKRLLPTRRLSDESEAQFQERRLKMTDQLKTLSQMMLKDFEFETRHDDYDLRILELKQMIDNFTKAFEV